MSPSQPGILAAIPAAGRFVTFDLSPGASPAEVLPTVAALAVDDGLVVGLGDPLVQGRAGAPRGLRTFPAFTGPGVAFPSTQGALWLFLRGDDSAALLLHARELALRFEGRLAVAEDVATFRYAEGRDLTGYEDGTENPKGERAVETAIVTNADDGLDGGSYVAAQRWVHDLRRFEVMTAEARNYAIGRDRHTNEELSDAPASAHVKRTAQESFEPAAFMLRRSMPYGDLATHGLYFVAFGASLDPFERVLSRMAGLDDGVTDALLGFSRPVTGGYYWCPPARDGRLDLRALDTG